MDKKLMGMVPILFSGALLTGGAVCLICDAALSGGWTWSHIPAVSIAFAWAVLFPVLAWGKRGLSGSLLSLSVFLFPYLRELSRLTNAPAVFSIGSVMAAISLVFLWLLFAVFKRRGRAAAGSAFLLAALFTLAIQAALSAMTAAPLLNIWGALSISLLLILAFASFVRERVRNSVK